MKLPMVNRAGESVGEIEVLDDVFATEVNGALLHQAVTAYLASQRQGTASTRLRGEVRGGGRKPWRQKGTGRARAGSNRSPLWRKGGVTFGPRPRDFRLDMPKRMRHAALRAALSAKVRDQELIVVDELSLEAPRTKTIRACLEAVGAPRALIVTGGIDHSVYLSTRNLPGSDVLPARDLSVYPLLAHPQIVITKAAVEALEEVLG